MLISARRLKLGLFVMLAGTAALLVRPVRSWIDDLAIQQILGPDFSARECILHTKESVVEIRDLQWESVGERTITFSAKRGWIAFQQEPLLDRRMILPGAIFRDATLKLDEQVSTTPPLSLWKQTLANQVASLDWQALESQFNSLLASSNLQRAWTERLENWVDRSNTIAAGAAEQNADLTSLENPLRSEEELNNRWEQLQRFAEQQAKLSAELSDASDLVEQDLGELRELLLADEEQIDTLIAEHGHNPAFIERVAREMLIHSAQDYWQEIAEFGEVGDRLTRAASHTIARPRGANDVNIRKPRNPLKEIERLRAHGTFEFGEAEETPFEIRSQIAVHQSPIDFATDVNAFWQLRFGPTERSTFLVVSGRPGQPAINDIQCASVTAGSADADCTHTVLVSDGQTLEGTLTLPAEWIRARFGDTEAVCCFHVSGSWLAPQLEPTTPIPNLLTNVATRSVEDAFSAAQANAKLKLRELFAKRADDLEIQIHETLAGHRQLAQVHSDQIASSLTRVEGFISEVNGTSFARRPGSIHR